MGGGRSNNRKTLIGCFDLFFFSFFFFVQHLFCTTRRAVRLLLLIIFDRQWDVIYASVCPIDDWTSDALHAFTYHYSMHVILNCNSYMANLQLWQSYSMLNKHNKSNSSQGCCSAISAAAAALNQMLTLFAADVFRSRHAEQNFHKT